MRDYTGKPVMIVRSKVPKHKRAEVVMRACSMVNTDGITVSALEVLLEMRGKSLEEEK